MVLHINVCWMHLTQQIEPIIKSTPSAKLRLFCIKSNNLFPIHHCGSVPKFLIDHFLYGMGFFQIDNFQKIECDLVSDTATDHGPNGLFMGKKPHHPVNHGPLFYGN